MYQILINDQPIKNPRFSQNCTGFERNEIQKMKKRYPGAQVKNTSNGEINPIEKF